MTLRYFWELASCALIIYIIFERQTCHPCKCPDTKVIVGKEGNKPKKLPMQFIEYKTVADPETIQVIKQTIVNLTAEQKDSLLSEYLGINVFTREFADTLLEAFQVDTVQANKIRGGSLVYKLKKPMITVLPEPKKRNKLFLGIGAFGNKDQVYFAPEFLFLTKKDNYIAGRYDPVNRAAGISAGFKIGKRND
jgi:hypothetical protein